MSSISEITAYICSKPRGFFLNYKAKHYGKFKYNACIRKVFVFMESDCSSFFSPYNDYYKCLDIIIILCMFLCI